MRWEATLCPELGEAEGEALYEMDEKTFRWTHNQDARFVDELAAGIREFDDDAGKLERWALENSSATRARPNGSSSAARSRAIILRGGTKRLRSATPFHRSGD